MPVQEWNEANTRVFDIAEREKPKSQNKFSHSVQLGFFIVFMGYSWRIEKRFERILAFFFKTSFTLRLPLSISFYLSAGFISSLGWTSCFSSQLFNSDFINRKALSAVKLMRRKQRFPNSSRRSQHARH